MVHGDGFTFLSYGWDFEAIVKEMNSWYDIKVCAAVGEETVDDKEVTILNQRLSWRGGLSPMKRTTGMRGGSWRTWVYAKILMEGARR